MDQYQSLDFTSFSISIFYKCFLSFSLPGSYDSTGISTTTSWEYLSSKPLQHSHAKSRHSRSEDLEDSSTNHWKCSSNSTSFAFESHDIDIQVVLVENNEPAPSQSQQFHHFDKPSPKNYSRKINPVSDRSVRISAGPAEANPTGGPIECDIYSLPLDNLPPGSTDTTRTIIDEIIRHRFEKYDNSRKPLRHSIHIGESLESRISEEQCSSRAARTRNNQRQHRNSFDLRTVSEENALAEAFETRLERNNNDEEPVESSLAQRKSSSQRIKKRRGESATDKIENTRPSEQFDSQETPSHSHCKNPTTYRS